jgi:hypothetical protein
MTDQKPWRLEDLVFESMGAGSTRIGLTTPSSLVSGRSAASTKRAKGPTVCAGSGR